MRHIKASAHAGAAVACGDCAIAGLARKLSSSSSLASPVHYWSAVARCLCSSILRCLQLLAYFTPFSSLAFSTLGPVVRNRGLREKHKTKAHKTRSCDRERKARHDKNHYKGPRKYSKLALTFRASERGEGGLDLVRKVEFKAFSARIFARIYVQKHSACQMHWRIHARHAENHVTCTKNSRSD